MLQLVCSQKKVAIREGTAEGRGAQVCDASCAAGQVGTFSEQLNNGKGENHDGETTD